MSIFICPLCKGTLERDGGALRCPLGHSYDLSKRNYVNLLPPKQRVPGDNKAMVAARRDFLSAAYYFPLAEALSARLDGEGTVIDAGCGEGYYTGRLRCERVAAVDISKDALYAAGARTYASPVELAVASVFELPVGEGAADAVLSVFAPLCPVEFRRVLRPEGRLIVAAPGADHLMELKRILYDEPYPNDEAPPEAEGFRLESSERLKYSFRCTHLQELFMMTPYAYHTPEEGRRQLSETSEAELTADFLIYEFKRI